MSGWQPIDTAPTDGTWVLVFDPVGSPLWELPPDWNPYEDNKPWQKLFIAQSQKWVGVSGELDKWTTCTHQGWATIDPTYWMDLPEDPKRWSWWRDDSRREQASLGALR